MTFILTIAHAPNSRKLFIFAGSSRRHVLSSRRHIWPRPNAARQIAASNFFVLDSDLHQFSSIDRGGKVCTSSSAFGIGIVNQKWQIWPLCCPAPPVKLLQLDSSKWLPCPHKKKKPHEILKRAEPLRRIAGSTHNVWEKAIKKSALRRKEPYGMLKSRNVPNHRL